MVSIESGIKYLVELEGTEAPHTHSVKELLAALPPKYYNSNWYNLLEKWKRPTDTWYSDSRYSDSFSAVNNIVEDYFSACKQLLQEADEKISYVCTTENKVKRILNKLNSTTAVSEVMRYLPDADLPEDVLFGLVTDILKISKEVY